MKRIHIALVLASLGVIEPALGQAYIGFVYPAGGQRGTTFQVHLGGQGLEGVTNLYITGAGVRGRVVEYNKRMNPQEVRILSDQLQELKNPPGQAAPDPKYTNMAARITRLVRDNVDQPACAAIANRVVAEITIDADAPPGRRELRVDTPRGPSNPLVFLVGELPEVTGEVVPASRLITLGKEAASLRRKSREPAAAEMMDSMMSAMMSAVGPSGTPGDLDDDVVALTLPCTVNGQITSGTVDRYRFRARKGQQLVLRAQARELVPYLADAVPGWFQPVLALWDARGREVAYKDDYRFKPDPVVVYEVPEDGDYLFAIYDAIYRGREDFVYRVSIGELPFVTGVFPLGGPAGAATELTLRGVNLAATRVPAPAGGPGVQAVTGRGSDGRLSNPVPFALDTLPECREREGNDDERRAQPLALPVIVNGRIDRPGDADVFEIEGRAGDVVVAEVTARRLDSPLDSVLKLTDEQGRCLALNDDREDATSGLNTHHADSYLRVTLPAAGRYRLRLADTQHQGGDDYAYRLRVSAPQPEFALRVVPPSLMVRSNAPAYPAVHLIRNDGFTNPVVVSLPDPPPGLFMRPVTFIGTQAMVRVEVRTTRAEAAGPFPLRIVGTVSNGAQTVVRAAVPAEDRMQAFLWRHLMPAQELVAVTYPPTRPADPPKGDKGKGDGKKPAAVTKN